MPSGYTYEVSERDDLSFEEFVWKCARAFGALMHMRDDSMDTPIVMPKEDSYHKENLERAKENLVRYKKMSLKQARLERDKEYERTQKDAKESMEEKHKIKIRYETMIQKVSNWIPPSEEHKGIKEFMLQQLNDSLKWDCSTSYYDDILKRDKLTADEWRQSKIDSAQHDIKYHTEHLEKEIEGTKKAINWLNLLQHSVPMPKVVKKAKK